MLFLRLLRAELDKVRDLMALLSLVGGPAAVGLLAFLYGAARSAGAPAELRDVVGHLLAFWAFFMFPLSVTAFAAFYAQVEHRARAWDHILALPTPKWLLFSVKAVTATGATAAMHLLFLVFVPLGGILGGLLSPHGPLTGGIALGSLVRGLALMEGASLLMIAIQLWVSLRVSHFAAPIMLGVGAFAATMAGGIFGRVDEIRLFPWALPMTMANARPPLTDQLLAYGIAGGLLVFAAMAADLSRREMR